MRYRIGPEPEGIVQWLVVLFDENPVYVKQNEVVSNRCHYVGSEQHPVKYCQILGALLWKLFSVENMRHSNRAVVVIESKVPVCNIKSNVNKHSTNRLQNDEDEYSLGWRLFEKFFVHENH